jgi:hypothetical protein
MSCCAVALSSEGWLVLVGMIILIKVNGQKQKCGTAADDMFLYTYYPLAYV